MKKIVMTGILALGLMMGISTKAEQVEASERTGFEGVKAETVIEAGSNFSTVNGIKYYENGQQKNYSVYLHKSSTGYKKVSGTHYINTKVAPARYTLRYENASGTIKKWKTVIVKDTKAPVFKGINNKTIKQYSKFSTVSGVSAYDLADGKRGYSVYLWKNGRYKKVSSKWYINTKYCGKYQLKYVVKDKSGNTATKYRKITVKASHKPVATGGNTVRYTVRHNDQRGWWYEDYDKQVIYHHSYAGEALANVKVGTKVFINGIPYVCYDKFVAWAPYPLYSGSSYAKQLHYVTRGGKSAKNAIYSAPLAMKTCYDNGYSKDMWALLKPTTSKEFNDNYYTGGGSITISEPQ